MPTLSEDKPSICYVDGVIPYKLRPRANFNARRMFDPKKNKDYEKNIARCYKSQCGVNYQDTPLEIAVVAKKPAKTYAQEYTPWTTKPDADNILKSVMDALNGIAYYDDNQIVAAQVVKIHSPRGSEKGIKIILKPYKEIGV